MTNRQLLACLTSAVQEGVGQAIKTLAIQPTTYTAPYFYQPFPASPLVPQVEINQAAINFLDGFE